MRENDAAPPVAWTRKNQEGPTPLETDFTEPQLGTVLKCVSQRMLVDINEVLRAHGGKRASHNVYRVNYSSRSEMNDGSSRTHHRRYQASRFALEMVA